MHVFWPIVVALLTGSSGDRPAVTPIVHVRAAANAASMLVDAAAQSAVVRDLITRLSATDVIVYVEVTASPHDSSERMQRFSFTDPFGNRIEFLEYHAGHAGH